MYFRILYIVMYRCLLGLRIVSSDRDNEPVAQLKFVQAELPYVPVQDRSSFVRAQTAIVGHTHSTGNADWPV